MVGIYHKWRSGIATEVRDKNNRWIYICASGTRIGMVGSGTGKSGNTERHKEDVGIE